MRIRNVNPMGEVEVVALGHRIVAAGEVIDVPDAAALLLLDQIGNWAPEPDPTNQTEV